MFIGSLILVVGVIWWGTRGACPPPLTLLAVRGTAYLMSPPPPPSHILGWKKITYFNICVLLSFLLDLSGLHVLTLYLYSDILSMNCIQRMRGNRNQSHNDLPIFFLKRGLQFVAPNIFITQSSTAYVKGPLKRRERKPFVDHWLERVITQLVHQDGSTQRPIAP